MAFLSNLRIRRKLLLALAPRALMAIVAALYSSIESKVIDSWYTDLIDKDLSALRSLTEAQAAVSELAVSTLSSLLLRSYFSSRSSAKTR
jgi:hypothetical protein